MPYGPQELLIPDPDVPSLGRIMPFRASHSALDARSYLPALGLFGTAGDPEHVYNWRADVIPVIEEAIAVRGLSDVVSVFNPQKVEWKPEDAAIEARHLARDASLVLPVLDITAGHGSLAETGFAALGGMLRPQKIHMYIESGSDYDDSIKRARTLTNLLAAKTIHDFTINTKMAKDLGTMIEAGIHDVGDFAEQITSRVNQDFRFTVERRTDLQPRVALVGSGAERYQNSWYEGMARLLDANDVPAKEQYSAYAKDWTIDEAVTELEHKTEDAVVLFVVTKEQSSFGAMGELGWLMAYCVLNGQKLGVYVEPHDSEPKSDENRQRKLAMSHMGRQLLDFPDLPVFVASDPRELARYGASELAKYKQFQLACGVQM